MVLELSIFDILLIWTALKVATDLISVAGTRGLIRRQYYSKLAAAR